MSTKFLQRDQVLSIGIMFIEKIATLVGVATPLGLTIAYSLNTADLKKSARTARASQDRHQVVAFQIFRTSIIM